MEEELEVAHAHAEGNIRFLLLLQETLEVELAELGAAMNSGDLGSASGARVLVLPWPVTTVFAKARSLPPTFRVFPRGSNCSNTFVRQSSGNASRKLTQLESRPHLVTNSSTAGSEDITPTSCASVGVCSRLAELGLQDRKSVV